MCRVPYQHVVLPIYRGVRQEIAIHLEIHTVIYGNGHCRTNNVLFIDDFFLASTRRYDI